METLNELARSSHWSQKVFKSNNIPLKVVSKFINRDYFYTCRLLNATIRPTPEIEARIGQLVELVRGGVNDAKR
jgi:hypothetical protein